MKPDKIKLRFRAKIANRLANGTNALIHWQPFNNVVIRAVYGWMDTVRVNDPAWDRYMQQQLEQRVENLDKNKHDRPEEGSGGLQPA